MPPTSPQTRHSVTAVIVAHDGARMLPGLVKALFAQTHPVGRIVGVDTGSRDRGGAFLAELIGQDAVFGMDRATGFGQAIWGALRRVPARRVDDSGQQQVEWIWLLHDDCEPAPETLERLLRAASRDRSVTVLGPKVLDGTDRRVLREAGVSIDRSGRRVTGIDPGEYDQGQHDHNRSVLAVGSAGMLVRRDVWEQLGGYDTSLRLFRDDVDFCWRAHAAGYRVQVVTDAVLYHRELTARRGRAPEGTTARRLDRRNALYVLAVNLPLLVMLRTMAGCVAGSLVRAGYFLVTKQMDDAADQVHALGGLFLHPARIWRARRRRAPGLRRGYDAVRMFIPKARPLRVLSEAVMSLMSPVGTGGSHHAGAGAGSDTESGEDEQFVDSPSLARRIIASHGVQLFAALLVISLVAERRLLGGGALGGGALVPAWGGAPALWSEYLAGFHGVGVGSTASAPPYVAVVAVLGFVLGGQAWLAVDILLLGCVPLAGLTAYLCSRRLAPAPLARMWLAAAYALLPVAMGAVSAGRLGTATVLIIAPLLARAAGVMVTDTGRRARSAAWATGLLVALAAAFVPLVWIAAAVAVLVLLAVGLLPWGALSLGPLSMRAASPGTLRPVSAVNAAIVVATPFAILFPWSLHLLSSPSAFLLEAGVQRSGLSAVSLRPSALLLLSPGGPGLPPVWVTVGFGLALVGVFLGRRMPIVVAGWCVAVAGFAAALAVARSTVGTVDGGGSVTSAWPGTALTIAAIGLLIAAAPAAEWLVGGLSRPDATGRGRPAGAPPRVVAILALVAVASAPVLAAWFWVAGGVRGPVGGVSSPVLPAFVASTSVGGPEYRTLVLREDDGVLTYSVIRQGDPTLGEPELAGYAPAEQALARQVAALGAADGADAGDPGLALGEFGIRWVILPSPVSPVLAERLNASVGLIARSSAPAYDLWQVTGPVSRVRVIGPDGTVTALAGNGAGSVPASGGTVVLAEPSGGWTATVNGHALTPVAKPYDGWAQAFTLPPGGGTLAITRANTARDISLIVEVIAFLAACVLAVPGKRAEAADASAAPPDVQRERPRAALSAPEDADAERAIGRRAAREGARNQGSRTGIPIGGARRRPTGPRAGGSHAAGSQTAVLPPASRPDAAASGPVADVGDKAGVGVLAAAEEPASQPGTVPPWETRDWPLTTGSGPLPTSPGRATGGRRAISAGPATGPGAGSGPGPASGPFGKADASADEHWADVMAEHDSGAWPVQPPDEPSRDTSVLNPPAGASPGRTSPSPAIPSPSSGWLSGSPTGWGTGPKTDGNADWTSASGTGPIPRRATGPGPTANAERPTGPGTGPSPRWTTGPQSLPGSDRPGPTGADGGSDWLRSSPADSGTGRKTDGNAGWTSASGTGPRPSWPAGPGRTGPDGGANTGWSSQPSPAWGTDSDETASQAASRKPWESMPGTPPPEPAPGASPASRKPASHRAGRHGRPSRRPWDRSGKDKDGES